MQIHSRVITQKAREPSPDLVVSMNSRESNTRISASVIALILFFICSSSIAQPAECGQEDIGCVRQRLTPGTGIRAVEPTRESLGKYKGVMHWTTGCTATVIAPYAVLTAAHCGGGPGSTIAWPATPTTMAVASVYANPYVIGLKESQKNWPKWFVKLNDEQVALGIRSDDWPAMHDQRIAFVPQLTPQFLSEFRIYTDIVRPYAETDSQHTRVGVGSGVNQAERKSIPQIYVRATENQIIERRIQRGTSRDGYLKTDHVLGTPDGGDSGGPTFGSKEIVMPNGNTVLVSRNIMGTAQNTAGDLAPLGYNAHIPMTKNQKDTVRRNHLWVSARMNDADGDQLPTPCDPDPVTVNAMRQNLCPSPVGSRRKDYPEGQIECKAGYFPTGFQGKEGWLVDQIALQCTPVYCLERQLSTTCGDAYWTDHFGGDGGTAFRMQCGDNKIVTGFHGRSSTVINQLGLICKPYFSDSAVDRISVRSSVGNDRGARRDGTPFEIECNPEDQLSAINVHSADGTTVTSLQAVCSETSRRATRYVGGTGGDGHSLACPVGTAATGIIQTVEDVNGGRLKFLGLACEPLSLVNKSERSRDVITTVIHGSSHDSRRRVQIPAGRQQLANLFRPHAEVVAGVIPIKFCPLGSVLKALQIRSRGAQPTLHSIHKMTCYSLSEPGTEQSEIVTSPVFSDLTGDNSITLNCNGFRYVAGMYVRSGSLIDGLSLLCEG